MIRLTAESKILLAVKPVDFRKQIDGLVALTQHQLQQNPRTETLFVFINRSKTMIRLLTYDGTGYWLATKRLSRGHFSAWPQGSERLSSWHAAQMMNLIKGQALGKPVEIN